MTESKNDQLAGIEDVQNRPDIRHLDINKVGIKSIRHPVVVKDKHGGEQNTVAVFDMYVHLPHNFKGTHMSRLLKSSTVTNTPFPLNRLKPYSEKWSNALRQNLAT